MLITDASAQADYLAEKEIAPWIEEMINRPMFASQWSNVPVLPANFKDLDPAEQERLKQDQMIAFRQEERRRSGPYAPQIPIEALV